MIKNKIKGVFIWEKATLILFIQPQTLVMNAKQFTALQKVNNTVYNFFPMQNLK